MKKIGLISIFITFIPTVLIVIFSFKYGIVLNDSSIIIGASICFIIFTVLIYKFYKVIIVSHNKVELIYLLFIKRVVIKTDTIEKIIIKVDKRKWSYNCVVVFFKSGEFKKIYLIAYEFELHNLKNVLKNEGLAVDFQRLDNQG